MGKYIPSLTATQSAKFWDRVGVTCLGDCWPWLGSVSKDGYGLFSYGTFGNLKAHRVMLSLIGGGDIGEKLGIHTCENEASYIGPHCVNPCHLKAGTQDENFEYMRIRDFRKPGGWLTGEQHPNHTLTDEQVIEIVRRHVLGERVSKIAKDFSTTVAHVSAICRGHTRKEASGVREATRRRHLTAPQVRDIRQMAASGITQVVIAQRFGITQAMVSKIILKDCWPTV